MKYLYYSIARCMERDHLSCKHEPYYLANLVGSLIKALCLNIAQFRLDNDKRCVCRESSTFASLQYVCSTN